MTDPSPPLDGVRLTADDLWFVGQDLQRPECILAEPDGSLWSADARGGGVHIRPDGTQSLIAQQVATSFDDAQGDAQRFTEGTLPNGLAFDTDSSILVSNFGTDCLERMSLTSESQMLSDSVGGTRDELRGTRIQAFKSPMAGLPMAHWTA